MYPSFVSRLHLMIIFLCMSNQIACAQTLIADGKGPFEVWMPAIAALFGGLISGILGPFFKDVLIQRWNERRSDQRLREEIEQSYFAPLSASAEKLIWRMSEMLINQRSHFLMLKARPEEFNIYKRLSTLYRIAALLGWIRAYHLELSALPRGGFGVSSDTFKALAKVQSAMADGQGVEEKRFTAFCKICEIDISNLGSSQIFSLAAGFEVALYSLAGEEFWNNHRHVLESSLLKKDFICRGLLQFLSEKNLIHSVDDQKLRLIVADLVQCLGYKESLIYREWQESIGDAMIAKDENSTARRYRIIGFEDFERLIDSGTSNWIEPLREFIEDVDLEISDPADQRPSHLRELACGVAQILVAISNSSQGLLVNNQALQQAKDILKIT